MAVLKPFSLHLCRAAEDLSWAFAQSVRGTPAARNRFVGWALRRLRTYEKYAFAGSSRSALARIIHDAISADGRDRNRVMNDPG